MKLRNTVHSAVAILLYGMLTACAGAPLPPADNGSSRAMAVPGDEGMLAQRLRESLRERGWSLIEYDADALGRNRGYAGLARQAKYRLTLSGDRIGNCRGGTPSFLYNLAVIENASGRVDLALTGASCLDTVVTRFEADLDRKELVIPTVGAGG
jgi:hypothetical protein